MNAHLCLYLQKVTDLLAGIVLTNANKINVVDDCNREALSIEIDLNLPALRVVRVLDRITASAVIRPCCVWIRDRNLSRWHWLNGQRNMQ